MNRDFEWDDIRVFLAACRAETLTGAAQTLKVSQPTAGRRLKALEERLGATLFERQPDRLVLTEAGRALLPYAEEMEQQSLALSQVLDSVAPETNKVVRVTAIESLAVFLARTFGEVEARCAPHAVELIATGERLNLARQEADIAFRMNAVPTRGDLVCRKLGRMAFALYAERDRAQQLGQDQEAARSARFIGYRENPRKASQSSWLFDFGRDGSFPLRVSDLQLRYEAARSGQGITLLPCHLGDATPELGRVGGPIAALDEDIYLLMHESRKAQPAVRHVAEALAELIRVRQDALTGVGQT